MKGILGVTRLTLKDLTPAQRRELDDLLSAACKAHGVKYAFDLPEEARQEVTRQTMDKFSAEFEARFLAAERARSTNQAPAPEVKTFTWGANRRR